MRDWQGKRYWLIGASEGLGRELARVMSRAGTDLVLSARTAARLESLAGELPGRTEVLPMDVTDPAAVAAAAQQAGEIDGVICMAGQYAPMTARQWDAGQAAAFCDVNLTGTVRVLGTVMPGMMERGRGHVVLVSSLAAYRGLPGMIGYGAAKAGVLSLAESMRADLRDTEIEVQVVLPGYIRTRMTAQNDFAMPGLLDPEDAAQRMFDFMLSDQFRATLPGPMGLAMRLAQFLPDWAWNPLLPKR